MDIDPFSGGTRLCVYQRNERGQAGQLVTEAKLLNNSAQVLGALAEHYSDKGFIVIIEAIP